MVFVISDCGLICWKWRLSYTSWISLRGKSSIDNYWVQKKH